MSLFVFGLYLDRTFAQRKSKSQSEVSRCMLECVSRACGL